MFLTWLHGSVEVSAELIAFATNSLVFYFVCTERAKELSDYKNLLILDCLIDYVCTLVQAANQPRFEFAGEYYVHIGSWFVALFPRVGQCLIVGFYAWAVGFGLMALTLQFWYRYQLICKKRVLDGLQLAKLLSVCLLFGGYLWIMYAWIFISYSVDVETVGWDLLRSNPYILDPDTGRLPPILIAKQDVLPLRLVAGGVALVNVSVVATIITLSVRTYRSLKVASVEMTSKTKRLNQQINRLLAIQATLVFASAFFPHSLFVASVASGASLNGVGTLGSISPSFIQCINPVCTLFLVGRYRQRLLRLLPLPCLKRTKLLERSGESVTVAPTMAPRTMVTMTARETPALGQQLTKSGQLVSCTYVNHEV